eukprot:14056-Heterococcus_DN1.PRE.1
MAYFIAIKLSSPPAASRSSCVLSLARHSEGVNSALLTATAAVSTAAASATAATAAAAAKAIAAAATAALQWHSAVATHSAASSVMSTTAGCSPLSLLLLLLLPAAVAAAAVGDSRFKPEACTQRLLLLALLLTLLPLPLYIGECDKHGGGAIAALPCAG